MAQRIAAALLVAIVAAACSGPAPTPTPTVALTAAAVETTPPPAFEPSAPNELSREARAAIVQACANVKSALRDQCLDLMAFVVETSPGQLAAICEYVDGTLDIVVPLDRKSDAQKECSSGGIVPVDRVIQVGRLPK